MKNLFNKTINCALLISSCLICNIVSATDSTDPKLIPKNIVPNNIFVLSTGQIDPTITASGSTFTVQAACPATTGFHPYMTIQIYKITGTSSDTSSQFATCVQSIKTSGKTTQVTYLLANIRTMYGYDHVRATGGDHDLYGSWDDWQFIVGRTNHIYYDKTIWDYTTFPNSGLQWVLYCYPPNIPTPPVSPYCNVNQIPYNIS